MPIVIRPTTAPEPIEGLPTATFSQQDSEWESCFRGIDSKGRVFISRASSTLAEVIKIVIETAEEKKLDVVVLMVPEEGALDFAVQLGKFALAHNWVTSPLREIKVYSSAPACHEEVNSYFMGYWHL